MQAYAEESLSVIKKQKDLIDKITKDNDAIKTELETELRYASRRPVSETASSHLHDQLDLYIGKVEIEHKNIESLQKQVEIMRSKVVKESKVIGGINAAKEAERQLDKKVKVLENRLEKALVRFNEALAGNKEMRNTIDTLRQERAVFEGVYAKLEKELADKKRSMAGLIESSNQAYEARDLATMETSKIKQEMAAERVVFEQQLAAMDAAVDAEVEAARQKEFEMRGTLTMEEEETLKRDLKDGQREVAATAAAARSYAGRVEQYEAAFTRIKDETGIEEVEELVAVFLKNEDANFALFNYVAEQSAELQRLEDVLTRLRHKAMGYDAGRRVLLEAGGPPGTGAAAAAGVLADVTAKATVTAGGKASSATSGSSGSGSASAGGSARASSGAASASSSSSDSGVLARLGVHLPSSQFTTQQNQQLLALAAQIDRAERRRDVCKRTIEAIRAQLETIVTSIGAASLPAAQLALTDGRVTETNMMRALGLVEQRMNTLLAGYAALTRAANEEQRSVGSPIRGGVADGSSSSSSLPSSPEAKAAMSLSGTGPTYRPGAANDRVQPTLPAISDFGASREADGDDDEEEDEDGVARPLSLAEIKNQQASKAAAAAQPSVMGGGHPMGLAAVGWGTGKADSNR